MFMGLGTGFIAAADPVSKVARSFVNVQDLTNAMENYGYIPIRQDGSPMVVTYLSSEGGYLLDGAPMNVYFQGVWYQGQQEVASKYWGQSGVPAPPANLLALPVVPAPADVLAQYAAFKNVPQAQSLLEASAGGIPWGWVIIGVGVIWFLTR